MNKQKFSSSLAKQLEEVRKNKVKELQGKITSGRYKINNQVIAKSLLPPGMDSSSKG